MLEHCCLDTNAEQHANERVKHGAALQHEPHLCLVHWQEFSTKTPLQTPALLLHALPEISKLLYQGVIPRPCPRLLGQFSDALIRGMTFLPSAEYSRMIFWAKQNLIADKEVVKQGMEERLRHASA